MVLFVKLIQLFFISYPSPNIIFCKGFGFGMTGVGIGDVDGMTGFVYKVFLVITSIKQGFYPQLSGKEF